MLIALQSLLFLDYIDVVIEDCTKTNKLKIVMIGWGLIIQIGAGLALTGAGLYGMFGMVPNDPKKPSQKFLEKVKKVLAERGWFFWVSTGVGVAGIATLSLATWNYKNGREPDLDFLYRFIPKKFDPTLHGIGNPSLKLLEDHFLYTSEYVEQPHIKTNRNLLLTQYLSFDPALVDPKHYAFYQEEYIQRIIHLARNVNMPQWLAAKPTNLDHLTRCLDYLEQHPELNQAYEERFITFLKTTLPPRV